MEEAGASVEDTNTENSQEVVYAERLAAYRCRITGEVMREPLLASDGMQKI